MTKSKKTGMLIGFTLIFAAGAALIIYTETKRRKRLRVVSEAGFETAQDVYYPLRINRPGKGAIGKPQN